MRDYRRIVTTALSAFFAAFFWSLHLLIARSILTRSFDEFVEKGVPSSLWLVSVPLAGILFFLLWRTRIVKERPLVLFYLPLGNALLFAASTVYGRFIILFSFPVTVLALWFLFHDLFSWRAFLRVEVILRRHERWLPWGCMSVFFFWFFLFSYHRFSSFAAGSKDLGLFTQTIYLLSQGKAPINTILGSHAFGDHAEIIDFLVVPFFWVWQSPGALLLFQSLALAGGTWPLFRFARSKLHSSFLALLITLTYPNLLGIQSAIMYDFNPETVAAGFVPWLFLLTERKRWTMLLIPLLLIGLAKENLLLFTAVFGLFVALHYRAVIPGIAYFLLSSGIFLAELSWWFPRFIEGGFRHLRDKGFTVFGGSLGDICHFLIRDPARTVALLFTPDRKAFLLLHPFATLAYLPLLFPWTLLLIATIILTRYVGPFPNSWWGHFYSAVQETILLIALVYGAASFKSLRRAIVPVSLLTLFLFIITQPVGSADLYRFEAPYYPSAEQRERYREIVATIPPTASVIAQNHLVPHLSMREKIYIFDAKAPFGDAEFVAIDRRGSIWPNQEKEYRRLVAQIEKDHRYEEILRRGEVSLYRLRAKEGNQP